MMTSPDPLMVICLPSIVISPFFFIVIDAEPVFSTISSPAVIVIVLPTSSVSFSPTLVERSLPTEIALVAAHRSTRSWSSTPTVASTWSTAAHSHRLRRTDGDVRRPTVIASAAPDRMLARHADRQRLVQHARCAHGS